MAVERQYWVKACNMYALEDYPDVDDAAVEFPAEIHIAWAVCGKECGNADWIVDGGSQICERCGGSLFRTAVRRNLLIDGD